ncbi:MAG: deoxyribose-phosphate aldolase [Synergistaceae bacterium]|jgi:deoxyribose-phosphate aldolase|nr:deoxyribose-phosphate aldolase [Synergistaceae bacterium]
MKLSGYIDYTNLKPNASREDITKLCNEAIENSFVSVCVNPAFVSLASDLLKESKVKVCSVIGFPLGSNTTETKVYEAAEAAKNGASEVDMVINVSWLKDGAFDKVKEEIKAVVNAAPNCLVKVIIEACLLNNDEKIKACELSQQAGAHFVKTSTGFSTGGATVEDVALMREVVGSSMGVKAAGGIRDYDTALRMIEAGANRLGTSQLILM